jgi:fructose-1-phosphate kinase PfkB-like protein
VLALCGPYPGEALPLEVYGNLVTDVKANGVPVVVDLSPPRLDSALEGGPDLVKINDWELVPPRFERGSREGCGDSMMGGLAACMAAGLDWRRRVCMSAAAGAANFLRHGLGSGSRSVIEDLARKVELRRL